MDNIDTAKGVSDIIPMQDLFNEWHAKNTSDKVRKVMQSRGNAGIPITSNPPFGYKKSQADRNRWEIDRLIQKSYEDMSKGLISEERFAALSMSPEHEQRQLKASIPKLESNLNTAQDQGEDLHLFIDRIRKVTWLTELTSEIVHKFTEQIVVSKHEKIDGKRHQTVDIYRPVAS